MLKEIKRKMDIRNVLIVEHLLKLKNKAVLIVVEILINRILYNKKSKKFWNSFDFSFFK